MINKSMKKIAEQAIASLTRMSETEKQNIMAVFEIICDDNVKVEQSGEYIKLILDTITDKPNAKYSWEVL